jgi:hypothetical protein
LHQLAYDEVTKLSTGQMKLQVVSALDKRRYIGCLREELHDRPNNVPSLAQTVVPRTRTLAQLTVCACM